EGSLGGLTRQLDLGPLGHESTLSTVRRSLSPMAVAKKERWTAHWVHLYDEVVTSGLCTGCSGCVVACPHDVLGYNDQEGVYKPFHLEEELGPADCIHGEKGCTSCTRACPRFRTWETEIDTFMFGRTRTIDE